MKSCREKGFVEILTASSPNMSSKYCPRCNTTKPLDQWSKNHARKDGLQTMCKACDKIKSKKWSQANPDSAKRRLKRYRSKDDYKEKRRAYYRRRVEANTYITYPKDKLKHAANQMRRRAKLANNGIFFITTKELRRLTQQPCFYCGGEAATLDHVIPIAKGGRHSIGNLVAACKSCNSSKKDKFLITYKYQKMKG